MTESIENPCSFQDSENVAWQYFYNAFSVHTDLLYHRSNFTAIQVRSCQISLTSLALPSLALPPEFPLISCKIKSRLEADGWFVGIDRNG